MARLMVLALVVAALLFVFLWWFTRIPPERGARLLRRGGLLLLAALIIYLAATGRLHWLFALIGALIPFTLRLLRILQLVPWPLLQRLLAGLQPKGGGRSASTAGQRSRVRTRYLDMTLDHDTGEMDGEVQEGRYRGRQLRTMAAQDLIALLDECRTDAQSVAVLQAYLDRVHPEWRDTAEEQASAPDKEHGGEMTLEEAYDILGLKPGASREEIIATHRRLMQKIHPDRGGSDYLAAQINRAKDLLIKDSANTGKREA